MNLTYYGHACFAVEAGGRTLLFDPFISPNPLAKEIDIQSIKADYILVSHGHQDHLADAAAIASRTGAAIIAPYEVANWLGKQSSVKTRPINHGSTRFEFGRLRFVNAIHSSSLPDGTYGGNPGGFVVETTEESFYYSGDTALTKDMELIGESVSLSFAVLCIGGNFTMDVADAVAAAEMLSCDEVVGVHYDTFPPIKIDHEAAKKKFEEAGKHLHLLKIGETRDL
ncbi:MAG TPA: metal-dependent hydrolase [Verrucomicrobiae bacterium]|jgi:L-ascorbate metabolism protein UlaG (beta-lactamase superfamily)